MVRIKATKADVIWGYCGTILSMASGFILLPMLLFFLSGEELGLWYVFVAISNLTLLFEFGFNPAFSHLRAREQRGGEQHQRHNAARV